MLNKNKCELRGRLGSDVILRSTSTGKKVVNLSIATVESWKDKSTNEWVEATTWHRCEAWGPLAEICAKHGLKGDLVEVEAKIEYRQSEKDGIKYNDAVMVLKSFTRLDRPKAKAEEQAPAPAQDARKPAKGQKQPAQTFDLDDEIPF